MEQIKEVGYPTILSACTSASQGPLTPAKQFIGHLFDTDLQLYYFRSRYYDMRLGRFIQPDPMLVKYISGIGNQGVFLPSNLNLYVYAYNNPLSYTDPSGEAGLVHSYNHRRMLSAPTSEAPLVAAVTRHGNGVPKVGPVR